MGSGKYYRIGIHFDQYVLMTRQDLLAKENLSPPETFSEMLSQANQLNGLYGTEMGLAIGW